MEIFHVRSEWLVEGKEPMLQAESELEKGHRLDLVREASEALMALSSLSKGTKENLHQLIYGLGVKDADLINEALGGLSNLKADELKLLEGYRNAPARVAEGVRMMLGAFDGNAK